LKTDIYLNCTINSYLMSQTTHFQHYEDKVRNSVYQLFPVTGMQGHRRARGRCIVLLIVYLRGWSTSSRAVLLARKGHVPIVHDAGWAPGRFWTSVKKRKSVASTGFRISYRPVLIMPSLSRPPL